jgi:hypothetical protein
MSKRFLIRHGDVLVMSVDSIPADAVADGKMILAEGEVTGHAHRLKRCNQTIQDRVSNLAAGAPYAQRFIKGLDMFLQVLDDAGVDLVHEEHKTIHIPTGTYKVVIQREYSPSEIRKVVD